MLLLVFLLVQECIAVKLPLRIYGGADAKSDDYPFVVRIETNLYINFTQNIIIVHSGDICTAAALSPIWVISAAHCLFHPIQTIIQENPPHAIEKLIISYGHGINSPGISYSEVMYTVKHPLFTIGYRVDNFRMQVRNDIGLLKTAVMSIRTFIKLSAVDYKTFFGHEVVVAGLGMIPRNDSVDKGNIYNNVLLEKPLQHLKASISKCMDSQNLIPGLCLAPRCKDATSVCPGDSGGPVIHPSGLIGVISLGMSTGCLPMFKKKRTDVAAIAVPVSPYIEWIYSYLSI